ncbi:spore protease YyaC [Virgibacillus litoralis]|uniref:Sporulation protein YyaC n=1 Tax=Virgibacillus litoralis TaxID=578221 RepID=A0ABS4HEV2_9BACI|nr:spore protease YyaC [Virgibacillus litoralis]MBP1949452.1 putative sporulation protein YyaC [Virgibacillus litoralis]
MNLINRFVPKNDKLQLLHTDPTLTDAMSERLISWFPKTPREYVVVCIGTDRSTGDALGPLTGSFFSERKPKHINIYGTLADPVHAINLKDHIKLINAQHKDAFIIAVDASLGKLSSVGSIISDVGSLKPGAALNKDLPSVGNIHITGVVNISGFMEYSILQNTRLSLVVDMAKSIAALLETLDQQLTYNRPLPAIIASNQKRNSGVEV